jgi:hypothetical protein
MSSLLILFILTAVIGLAGVSAAFILALRLKHLKQQLRNLDPSIPKNSSSPQQPPAFQTPMLQATLKQRLQRNHGPGTTPDRYRMAAGMAAQGMTAQQIADLLMLPPAEVRQLIRLSRAGRPQPPLRPSAISTASLVDGMIN